MPISQYYHAYLVHHITEGALQYIKKLFTNACPLQNYLIIIQTYLISIQINY